MRIAPEGRLLIVILAALAVLAAAVATARGGAAPWAAAALLAAAALGTAFFFRDPRRSAPRVPGAVLAPADGRILEVEETAEEEWLDGASLRISTFLSLFDVHVNRYPVAGVVAHVARRGGGFVPAWRASAGASNARVSVGIETPGGERVLVRQVVGLVARRIVNPARVGDVVAAGDRMGMIRFGSRVDLFLPPGARPRVRPGDRAVGGRTLLAELAVEAPEVSGPAAGRPAVGGGA